MTLDEYKQEKKETEQRIAKFINDEVASFERKTSATVQNINLKESHFDVTTVNNEFPKYLYILEVKLKVDL